MGFSTHKVRSNNSLFILHTKNHVIITLVYVDDMLITGDSGELIESFVERLNTVFSLKDLGEFHFFLAIEVTRNNSGMFLSQRAALGIWPVACGPACDRL